MTQIELKEVTKVIKKIMVLNHISFSMESGRVYGLQGVNGSGKTMLMRVIIGLIHPTEGVVTINGKVLGADIEFAESLGFLLETPAFLDRYSGMENLKLLAAIKGNTTDEKIAETIATVGLDPTDKKKYRKYSLGMKQRLGIAAAIMESPDIVILDEPTNALDEAGVTVVKEIIRAQKERGAIVIISCHDLSILKELSDEIVRLEVGRVVEHIYSE